MSAVKNTPLHKKNGTAPDTKLSMRAAREAQNGLSATLANVRATQDGLTELDASARLQREGYNEVAHDKPPHAIVQFLQALNNPFIYVLLTLGGISFITDCWLPMQDGEEADPTKVIIIMTMVLLSSLLRFGRNTARPNPPKPSKPWCAPPQRCCAANKSAASRSCAKCRCASWSPATSCSCLPAT